jgi:hypothetical protein
MEKVFVSSLLAAVFSVSSAFAACPELETGGVDYDAIPIIVKDRIGDVSGFSTYYWDSANSSWSSSELTTTYLYDTNAALDLRSLGLCLDISSQGGGGQSALTLFLKIKMNGFPGAYKDTESGKVYLTGTGPLAEIATNPETFAGSMVFKIADAAKLSQGTPVYYMVASFSRVAGEFSVGDPESDPGPQAFYLMKSKQMISSKAEFDAIRFTSADSEFVADLDDHGQEGEPGEGGPGDGSGGTGPEDDSGQNGDDFSQGVPTEIHVAAQVAALSEYAGITKNSLVLISAEMTTEVASEGENELVGTAVAVSDAMKSAKGRLKKLKKRK